LSPGQNKQHGLVPLLRQSIYSRLAGYEDVNDAERLCVDRAMRHVVGGRATRPGKCAASTSEVSRFETQFISTPRNLFFCLALGPRYGERLPRNLSRLDNALATFSCGRSASPTELSAKTETLRQIRLELFRRIGWSARSQKWAAEG
jgi:hypothetical protein